MVFCKSFFSELVIYILGYPCSKLIGNGIFVVFCAILLIVNKQKKNTKLNVLAIIPESILVFVTILVSWYIYLIIYNGVYVIVNFPSLTFLPASIPILYAGAPSLKCATGTITSFILTVKPSL